MSDENPSILSHVSIGTNDFERALRFYDAVLPTLGCKRIMQHPGAVAWGKLYGTHIGFVAADKAAVHAFHAAALAGATEEGAPGSRPEYGEPYYGCFVRDLDGHKIEAAFWDLELMRKLYPESSNSSNG